LKHLVETDLVPRLKCTQLSSTSVTQ